MFKENNVDIKHSVIIKYSYSDTSEVFSIRGKVSIDVGELTTIIKGKGTTIVIKNDQLLYIYVEEKED